MRDDPYLSTTRQAESSQDKQRLRHDQRAAPYGAYAGGGALIRIAIRVRPGAPRTRVGGAYGDALVVHVAERAVDGRATAAALRAVAAAFGVPDGAVTLVTGATSRTKVVDVAGAAPDDLDRLRGA